MLMLCREASDGSEAALLELTQASSLGPGDGCQRGQWASGWAQLRERPMGVTCTWGWLELPPQLPALVIRLVPAEVLRGKGQAQTESSSLQTQGSSRGRRVPAEGQPKASGGPQTQIGTGRQTLAYPQEPVPMGLVLCPWGETLSWAIPPSGVTVKGAVT